MKNKEIMIRCRGSWFSDDYTMFVWLCRRSADSIKAEPRHRPANLGAEMVAPDTLDQLTLPCKALRLPGAVSVSLSHGFFTGQLTAPAAGRPSSP